MQGFYPAYSLGSGNPANSTQVLANGSYMDYPLNNYQYPLIQTFSALDPDSIYISGTTDCEMWNTGYEDYTNSDSFFNMTTNTQYLYSLIGPEILSGVLLEDGWGYANSYPIYEYVDYQNNHNATLNTLLSNDSSTGILEALYLYASLMQYNINGDQSISGLTPGDRILTIAGQTLAAKIVMQMYLNIATSGADSKLTVLVGDFGPMMSLFSLLDLPDVNPAFAEIPSYGSALVFELFTWDNGTEAAYPAADDLLVRFFYKNASADGTADSPDLQAYSLFDRGPSELDMTWEDFETMMGSVMRSGVGSWCDACASPSVWCDYYTYSGGTSSTPHRKTVSAVVAGVIGAAVTLAVGFLFVAAAMLCCGVRVHRRRDGTGAVFARRRSPSLGGFKGSAKLASDVDLTLAQNSEPVAGATVVAPAEAKSGHERVGSWEMREGAASPTDKAVEEGRFSTLAGSTVGARTSDVPTDARRPSFEVDDEIRFDTPVKAREGF